MHAFASDPEVTRYTEWGPNTPADTEQFLQAAIQDAGTRPRTRFALAMVERADDALIGSVELCITSRARQQATTGYALAKRCWGRGLTTEAAAAMLRLGFDQLGLHKITATCDPENAGSTRVLTKIGMHREGHLRDHAFIRGAWQDRLLFAAIRPNTGPRT
ncbi:GNAT family protein [Asanoa iriomotensis]|uniref:N-acetyltransferase n=1 Tax=Asanoa iriomotensis TaxID=234613 RepID=A0ABQ4CGJ6_9ACTN|nr:N-acetyltransferase [Asanoa iriomotensis]